MSVLGDSRTKGGPGIIPAQDHRPDIQLEKRTCHVATRVVDLSDDFVRDHIDDSTLRGDVQGLSVWALDGSNTAPRPCVMWRHAWPAIVEEFGDGDLEEPPPADSFPSFPGTPGGDGTGPFTPGGGDGGWIPGNVTADPRQGRSGAGIPPVSQPVGPSGWAVR